jgi:hypothetical protein
MYYLKGMTYGLCVYSIWLHSSSTEWTSQLTKFTFIALILYQTEDLDWWKLLGIAGIIIVHAGGSAGFVFDALNI